MHSHKDSNIYPRPLRDSDSLRLRHDFVLCLLLLLCWPSALAGLNAQEPVATGSLPVTVISTRGLLASGKAAAAVEADEATLRRAAAAAMNKELPINEATKLPPDSPLAKALSCLGPTWDQGTLVPATFDAYRDRDEVARWVQLLAVATAGSMLHAACG